MSRELRSISMLLIACALAVAGNARADWIDTVARALGISKTPSAMRGAGDDSRPGDLAVVRIEGDGRVTLTTGGLYRSPIFADGDKALLALEGEQLVRIPLQGGEPQRLQAVPEVVKLLGVDRGDPQRVLVLVAGKQGSELAVLSLKTGKLELLPHQGKDPAERRLLSHLRGEDRIYEGVSLEVRTQSKPGLQGRIEWEDVFVQRGGEPRMNLSRCDGASCGQPALSQDGQRIAFVIR
jgi:hypothetical protein